jgi:hypothetical protein
MGKIDYDRGVMKSVQPSTGVEVYMYLDEPGVYRNAFGDVITEKLAQEAGFDVEKFRKARIRRERMADAKRAIEEELDHSDVQTKVVKQRNGYALVSMGFGRYNIEDPDGQPLTDKPLTKQEAEAVFDKVVPDDTKGKTAKDVKTWVEEKEEAKPEVVTETKPNYREGQLSPAEKKATTEAYKPKEEGPASDKAKASQWANTKAKDKE